jgi:hypothetical protein
MPSITARAGGVMLPHHSRGFGYIGQ